jgi:hypothetical protein
MTNLETEILYYIKTNHKGKTNAIHFKQLAELLDINERELRDIVSGIIKSAKAPLCSISSGNGGYFFPENEAEFNHAQAEDISRIKELAKKHRGRRQAWIEYKQSGIFSKPKQLQLV